MNSSAEDLTDFRSPKSNLRKIASFPVCSFSSVMADFAFSSLREAMYTFALCASNACMFYFVRAWLTDSLALTTICLCRFFSNPCLKNGVLSISIYVRLRLSFWNVPVFAPVTMMTFPVKSGISSTLNLLWGGKVCEIIELIMPMVRHGLGGGGRNGR